MSDLTVESLARMIDHTALKPDVVEHDIARLCDEALEYGFIAVCVAPFWVRFAARRLLGSRTLVATVVGFPHGNTLPAVKAFEAEQAIAEGAAEVDMVVNIGALKSGAEGVVRDDIGGVVHAARQGADCKVKVILETALLVAAEKQAGCRLAERAGADFVKTSTGFAGAGATEQDVALFRSLVGDRLGVKASGGIRTLDDARAMIGAGATRLGCSSSVAIMEELRRSGGETDDGREQTRG